MSLVAVLPGDGIGPEITAEATRVLGAVARRYGASIELVSAPMGGCAIDLTGSPLPKTTLDLCLRSDAVLLGAVGGPKWETLEGTRRPEAGLLGLRKGLGTYANLRPVAPHPRLIERAPLRAELLKGVDLVVVRELTGGIYFGARGREGDKAFDTCTYTTGEIERVVRLAFSMARTRRRRVTSIDKANVLDTSRLWREVATRVGKEFPEVTLVHELVDAAAMRLVRSPADYDVIVTENLFGDILSDEASVLAGSIGMLPSASLGDGRLGLYEPIHGSAPDIAGRGIANPYGTVLSVAMLLRHSLRADEAARAIERAVGEAVDAGVVPADLGGKATTAECGTAVVERIH
ncbi:MAG TPA: 3-isopropylmalate dehydrogenase [Polyangiaceae bacterium]|nr:3-isopropylmalate dehydrogenase [Polyangiaceae bacterium]